MVAGRALDHPDRAAPPPAASRRWRCGSPRRPAAEIVNAELHAGLRRPARADRAPDARRRRRARRTTSTASPTRRRPGRSAAGCARRWRCSRPSAARGRDAIVVGGTGLYFQALTAGSGRHAAGAGGAPATRRPTRSTALGEAAFRAELARRATRRRRRAIAPGRPAAAGARPRGARAPPAGALSDWQAETRPPLAPRRVARAWCSSRRGTRSTPAATRACRGCSSGGALEEVRALLARGLPGELPAMKAVGVRELAAHLARRADARARRSPRCGRRPAATPSAS